MAPKKLVSAVGAAVVIVATPGVTVALKNEVAAVGEAVAMFWAAGPVAAIGISPSSAAAPSKRNFRPNCES